MADRSTHVDADAIAAVSLPIRPRLVVFDLDGTLIDSRVDLTNSVNAMLAHFGKPMLAEPTVASYIGDGAAALVRRTLAHAHLIADEPDPHDDKFIEEALEWFIRYYHVHKLDFTYVYPGAIAALEQIWAANPRIALAVLTNKPVRPSQAICRHFGLDRFFFANYGGNSLATKKPDPEGLLKLIAEAPIHGDGQGQIMPAETVMIGDSHVDVETARACGAWSVGCTFGLSPVSLKEAGPDVSVDHASAWPAALNLL